MNATVDPLPPAFYPVSLNLVGRRCIVIGDDREADEKSEALAEVGADLVRLRDARELRDEEIASAFFVISTPQDVALSTRLRALADEHRFLLCCIDQPAQGFVAMQAIVKAGPARIAISTGGVAPGVGKVFKHRLQAALDATFERFMECLRTQRLRNRTLLRSVPERRAAMNAATNGFAVEVSIRYPTWFEEAHERQGIRVLRTDGEGDGVDRDRNDRD